MHYSVYLHTVVTFEYDPAKSEINQAKHGINFEEAQLLWEDSDAVRITLNFETEQRYAVIGKIEEKHWTAIITFRNENIRIVSVRRSRKNEVSHYESRRI